MTASLQRATLCTSRLLDFASEKELVAQTGHRRDAWPLVILKELVDNGLDACEEAGIAPEITVSVDGSGITVADNGPGLPTKTIEGVLDFTVRVSSREAYVSPTRGAQGNALKTVVAMPFVLDGERGRVDIETGGIRHVINFRVDRIRQEPVVDLTSEVTDVKTGTLVRVMWPESACSILENARAHFLQIAADYAWLNPHLTLRARWFGDTARTATATDTAWSKWKPSDPTSPHWYTAAHLERLLAGYVSVDRERGRDRTVRDVVAEFRGLSGTAKKAVLDTTSLSRAPLSALVKGDALDRGTVESLLAAMKLHSKPVKPPMLGIIGKEHFQARLAELSCEMESFDYRRVMDVEDDIPWIIETAFGWCEQAESRRLVTGVNWSPGIVNPFRELGRFGMSLDTVLGKQRVTGDEPVVLALHIACPRVEYTDRGKSAVVTS